MHDLGKLCKYRVTNVHNIATNAIIHPKQKIQKVSNLRIDD